MADDEPETTGTTGKAAPSKRAATLLDVRRIIGGLLALYGVILTIAGIVSSDAQKHKAAGENVNLYTGLALLVVGGLFLVWSMTRPFVDPDELSDDPGPGGGEHP
ncbi:MAG: hypothetical protein QOJ07_2100 [Thermoleophilaceae bacterium]|jgi:hypothetical protein|nr:hypothetical protein [Thermoleophilaceae bacterium]